MVIHIVSHKAEPYYTQRRYYAQRWESNDLVIKERDTYFLETNPGCNPDRNGRNRATMTCYYDHWLRTRLIEPYNCTFFYLTRGVYGLETCDPDLVVRNYQHMDAKAGDFKVRRPPRIA
ncbi:hypothetical protein AAVH_15828 [Aphelenchoides avenae]|nr:hypothetical protein AAVH_15828 [Aphelenchus avenae]